MQGGVVQGIGWALNEEYIYNDKGLLDNAGFLDYRCPVASDLPMIDTIMVEVPNPVHPYGAKGVGEANICPPMAAIANAIEPGDRQADDRVADVAAAYPRLALRRLGIWLGSFSPRASRVATPAACGSSRWRQRTSAVC